MRKLAWGWLVVAAVSGLPAAAGVNQWTPTGPQGGSFRAVRYVGNGVALAVSMRSIHRSTDHGVTWTHVRDLYGNLNGVGTSIAVNPANTAQLIVMGFTAIYCSNDRGLTFTEVTDIAGTSVNSLQPVAVSFSRTGGIAWIAGSGAIYRSADGGRTWSARSSGIPANAWVSQLDTGAAGSSVEFAQVYDALYSTTDSGLNWLPIATPAPTQRFAVSPLVPGTMLAMDNSGQPYLSTNSGTSWTTGGAAEVYSVKYDPVTAGRAYGISYDYDFVRTDNDAATWAVRSSLPVSSPLDFDVDASNTQRVLAASNATLIASSDGGVNWTERVNGIHEAGVGRFVVSRGAASGLYVPTFGLHRAYRRDASTGMWNAIPTLPVGVFPNLYGSSALGVSPVDGNVLYMAASGVIGRSDNGGATWTSIGTLPADVASLIWDPSNELIGYAISANQGALKTVDGGAHWTPSGTGLPRIQSLVVDPANSSNLFATADFGQSGSVAVYRSTNGGASWSPSANGITQTFAWTLTFQPGNSAVLYAGTSGGLYKTTNSGASWTRVGLNVGFSSNVSSVSIDPDNTDIVYVLDTSFGSASSRTVDGGATWETLRMPDFGANNYPIYLTLVPGSRSLLAGAIYNGGIHEMEIAPDLELSTNAGGPLAIGVPRTLLLRSRNLDIYAATASRLVVTLPEAAAGYAVTDNGHTCVLATRQLTCTLGIVRAGATADVSVAFTPVTAGESLTAQLSAYEPDSIPANNTISVSTERRADVRAAIAGSATSRFVGERFDYTLTVTNDGPSAAAAVVATLQLPANVTYVSATQTGLTCTRNAQTLTCNAATLAANASASALVTVDATTAGAATANVSVDSTGTDPQTANNSASNNVTIERRADLRAALASSVTSRLTGERYDYTLTVTNDGPSAAASVAATLQLPANVTYVSFTATGLSCARSAQTVTCDVATLAVNASASAVITVDAATAGAATANLSVASAGADPQAANNAATNSVTVTAPATTPPPAPPPAKPPRSGGGGGALDYLLLAALGLLLIVRRRFGGGFRRVRSTQKALIPVSSRPIVS
ncbi:MAG TPA: hypothetical protein VFU13_08770 [Steroidobacteraceae bacterium]|nr:hypothetical protein [Steroidobacteraceae bacterium]